MKQKKKNRRAPPIWGPLGKDICLNLSSICTVWNWKAAKIMQKSKKAKNYRLADRGRTCDFLGEKSAEFLQSFLLAVYKFFRCGSEVIRSFPSKIGFGTKTEPFWTSTRQTHPANNLIFWWFGSFFHQRRDTSFLPSGSRRTRKRRHFSQKRSHLKKRNIIL